MSAGLASPTASGSRVPRDPVRALQHALYRAAKADPGRRFHALHDKISRSDVLWRAWVAVRSNNGAPGIDKITLAAVEEHGVTRLLGELAAELEEGRYRPVPASHRASPRPYILITVGLAAAVRRRSRWQVCAVSGIWSSADTKADATSRGVRSSGAKGARDEHSD